MKSCCEGVFGYGTRVYVHTPQSDTISRIGMLRAGSVTHAFNSDQRYIGLRFTHGGGDRLIVAPPPDGNIAPPGFYLLFLIDVNGIPSEGKFIQIPDPNVFPKKATVTAVSTHLGGTSLYVVGLDEGKGGGRVWSKFFPDPNNSNQWTNWFPL